MGDPRLEHWSFHVLDPYKAPEAAALYLSGVVTGHPRRADGETVFTSAVTAFDGKTAVTRSGTRYQLGAVDPKYIAFLRKIGKRAVLGVPLAKFAPRPRKRRRAR